MTTTAERTSATIAQELKETQERRAGFDEQLRELRGQIEVSRREQGTAVAQGRSTDALRRTIRDQEDEADGIARALPILDEAIAALESELKDAQRTEAVQGFRAAEEEAAEALEAMEEGLREAYAELQPVRDRLRAAIDAADEAARTEQRRTGSGVAREKVQGLLNQNAALMGLLSALRGFEEGDLTGVTTLNSKRQSNRIDW